LSQSGDSVQTIAARSGAGASWKTIAAANGIDNPRLLPPGTILNPHARTP
jgi:nucleoid-associated protein YgaU